MILGYKDFLLNTFIILIPLLFYQYTMKDNKWLRILSLYLLFVIPLILTMSFPIKAYETVYDFRAIPLAIGSLYGGIYSSLLLFLSLMVYRFTQGGINVLHYALALIPIFILTGFISRRYHSLRFRNKFIVAIFICFSIRTSSLLYFVFQGKFSYAQQLFFSSLPLFITLSILTGICVYVIEAIANNVRLKAEVFKTEKIRIVSDIAASVAHEVRNPLTAVRGFIQLLGDRTLPEDKRSQYSKLCLDELDRAQMIISDYLSLAKPEHDDNIERFDIKDEFQYITSILGSYANYQNVEIINNIGESVILLGNKSKFKQAIINFGKNSIEAMPNGGVLEFRSTVTNNRLELYLIDTGTGMTPEQVARLGVPYYSTKEKGTGLGTMVSYNIIQNMNGNIEVESSLGVGTTYKIILPLAA